MNLVKKVEDIIPEELSQKGKNENIFIKICITILSVITFVIVRKHKSKIEF